MINKSLIDEGKLIDVYIFESINNQMVIAVPDWLWSYQIEVSEIINRDTCIATLLMQLFVFKEEEEAEMIATQMTDWLETYKKEKE
ncbi:YueH family protein [Staphylococcus argenteus]|nr:YueH family protein [Staphylococcus argenteus]MCG9802372.1 YueH family protein [Staphylococcus argenteus]MCG9822163.1 YueH family protein [Staphylococcus argenteus]MCG9830707.1 YueH family protein [Staphylococcus argenteus]MCG9858948.1 YueH family protein [Staphylococcus argenteus]